MELKINLPENIAHEIVWNHEDLKREIEEKMKEYASVVYTDDQIKVAKADRATLNKFYNALETKRKQVKEQISAPYKRFEAEMKAVESGVLASINSIDKQIKEFEQQKKQLKLDEIKDAFESYIREHQKLEWVVLNRIMDPKWANASVSMTTVKKQIEEKMEQIAKDLAMLSNLPEFGFEAAEVYKSSLDVNKAVQEAQRMAEVQKRKAEAEARRKQQEEEQARMKAEAAARAAQEVEKELTKHTNPPAAEENLPGQASFTDAESFDQITREINPSEEERMWVSFRANLTTEDALALKDFFNSRKIQFEAI